MLSYLFSLYLKDREKDGWTGLVSVGSLLLPAAGLGQAEASHPKLNLGFLHGRLGPKDLSYDLLLSRVHSGRKLDQKRRWYSI